MKLLDTLENLGDLIKNNFYENLLKGNINEARKTACYITSLMPAINKELNDIAKTIKEPDAARDFVVTRKELQEKFIGFISLVDKELKNIDNKTFQEDPVLWKELLKETFSDITNQLWMIIEKLIQIVNREKEKEMRLYTKKYTNIKSRVKAYIDNQDKINKIEYKIIEQIANNNLKNPKITGRIKSGPWKGFYHAHLPMPLGDHRIVYSWNDKKILFCMIGTHKELEIS